MPSSFVTVENKAGDVFYGIEVDGTFISLGNVPAFRIKQMQERASNLSELAKSDDAEAVARHDEAAEALPYSTGGSGESKSKSKEGGES